MPSESSKSKEYLRIKVAILFNGEFSEEERDFKTVNVSSRDF